MAQRIISLDTDSHNSARLKMDAMFAELRTASGAAGNSQAIPPGPPASLVDGLHEINANFTTLFAHLSVSDRLRIKASDKVGVTNRITGEPSIVSKINGNFKKLYAFVPSGLYPGSRFYKLVGFQEWDSTTGTAALVNNRYNTYMKPQYHGAGDVCFAERKAIRWNTSLVDQNVTPTLEQARDPNWAGYSWKSTTTEIDNMMDALCVAQNKAKICIQISVSGTSGDPVPAFMLNNGWACTGSNSQERVKFYDATARKYVANFILAALDRYANDPRIGSRGFG